MRAPPIGTIFRFGGPRNVLVEILGVPFTPYTSLSNEELIRCRVAENVRIWYSPWKVVRKSRTAYIPAAQILGWMDKP